MSLAAKKWLESALIVLVAGGNTMMPASLCAAGNPEAIYFSGWLTSLDLKTHTITVKGKTTMVFALDLQKCTIVRNGNGSTGPAQLGGLRNANVGDAVVGKLSLAGPSSVVVRLDLTANPRYGRPVPDKPGFITSPYTTAITAPFDVRGYPRDAMVKDPLSGKVILIP